MNRDLSIVILGLFLGTSGAIAAGLSPERLKSLPPPADHKVDFAKEVKPIFEASCIKCHGRGKAKGGLSLENRGTLLKGGDSGAAIAPGKSGESYLIELVSGLNPDIVMPQKGSKLKPEQVGAQQVDMIPGVAGHRGVDRYRIRGLPLQSPVEQHQQVVRDDAVQIRQSGTHERREVGVLVTEAEELAPVAARHVREGKS